MTDPIERQAAIDAVKFGITYAKAINKSTGEIKELFKEGNKALNEAVERLKQLPSAQPEYRMDEWCTDCKEYDHERHCCPRFNHVIRTTLQEVKEEQVERKKGKWIVSFIRGNWKDTDIKTCSECGTTFRDLDIANYCPNCGLPMETEVEE